ncbi:acyl-CoA N-acyltransferase [Trematosphaeria pertusa]|uniref:Acyl-CoA N-acyltransferase n=1 Tax=Trematosphaeria pertusa TaxID=390896 RepID=A0A6A6HVE8_9PLEO|nr:acyl-CoA N-acyltransferase [Trematosphaeria pertusa]KAF2242076.1 acyl-CoA N-acyltransferase [Trematosphaeria pertusa]
MEAQLQNTAVTADSPLPSPIITTPRLIIRAMHPQDDISMQAAAAPASITKYMTLNFAHPYTLQHARDWISLHLAPRPNAFVLCLPSDPSSVIGGIGLKPGSDVQSHAAEMGYWIAEPYWGQGLMSEALEAMTEWSLSEWEGEGGRKLSRLSASVFEGNTGSMKCLEKCGYRKEGVLRGHVEKHGKTMDLHVFGLTKGDWEERKKGKQYGKN